MEQNQYAVVYDGMIEDMVWAENIIEAGSMFTKHGTLQSPSVIVNMTRLLESEDMTFPDKVAVIAANVER